MSVFQKYNSFVEMKWENNFSYVFSNEHQFMSTEFNMFKKMRNGSFLKCMKNFYNGKIQLYYLPENYKSLNEIKSAILPDNLLLVVMNLIKNIADIKGTGILVCNSIDISLDKIFVDMNTFDVKVVYIPSSERLFENEERFEKYFREEFVNLIQENFVMKSQKLEGLVSDLSNMSLTLNEIYDKMKRSNIKPINETEKTVKVYAKLIPTDLSDNTIISITKNDFVVGKKASEVDGLISNNKMISRVHCKIVKDNQQWGIIDLLSANGTFVNQVRIKSNQIYQVKDGDIIQLADCSFKFVIE